MLTPKPDKDITRKEQITPREYKHKRPQQSI